jgi:hypothetical protein
VEVIDDLLLQVLLDHRLPWSGQRSMLGSSIQLAGLDDVKRKNKHTKEK